MNGLTIIYQKFDLAHKLGRNINKIRSVIERKLKETQGREIQIYSIIHIIDKTGIRVGHENERGTYGCCTLEREHVKFHHNKRITLRFLGKHSILFHKTFEISPIVYNYLKKVKTRQLFPEVDPGTVNRRLDQFMKGLTAKVFRTYHTNYKLKELLAKKPKQTTARNWFKEANKKVAEFCNHTSVGTSKANYIDPRIVSNYCKKHDIPVSSVYSKALMEKFQM